MTPFLLPAWLPDWEGAEEIAGTIDAAGLRERVGQLLNLVFTEDTVFLDSLPESLGSNLVSPLSILRGMYEGDASLTELVVASRLVRRSVISHLIGGPEELKILIEALPE